MRGVKTGRKKREPAATMAAAAAMLETTLSVIKMAKNAGAPGFESNGSVDCAQVRAWLVANPTAILAESPKERLEIRRLTALCSRIEHDNEIKDRKYVLKADVELDMARIGAATLAALQKLLGDVPAMEGRTAPELAAWLQDKIERICADLNSETSALYSA